ncbi:MAG: hypothetical protein GY793_02060 [Proteobacteria bacterium]|nr:hypothetical protein [Pseudomonadota bacterium]
MIKVEISQRKLESYKKAEAFCREYRYQAACMTMKDEGKLFNMLLKWMRITGDIKYKRPLK